MRTIVVLLLGWGAACSSSPSSAVDGPGGPGSDAAIVGVEGGEQIGSACSSGLAVDGANLYFVEDGVGVVIHDKQTGAETIVPNTSGNVLSEIAVDDSDGYVYSAGGAVFRFPLQGGAMASVFTVSVPSNTIAFAMVRTADEVRIRFESFGYWSGDWAKGTIVGAHVPADAAATTEVDLGGPFVVGATDLFVAREAASDIQRVPLDGSPPITLATMQGDPMFFPASGIATDGTAAYWLAVKAGTEQVLSLPVTATPAVTPTTLATTTYPPNCVTGTDGTSGPLVVDHDTLYWIGVVHDTDPGPVQCGGDKVMELHGMPSSGGTPTLLAHTQAGARDLAVDDQFIYWIDGQYSAVVGGPLNDIPCRVMRVAR